MRFTKDEALNYDKLTPLMLNELQKQHQEIASQRDTIRFQKKQIAQQDEVYKKLEARLTALEVKQVSEK